MDPVGRPAHPPRIALLVGAAIAIWGQAGCGRTPIDVAPRCGGPGPETLTPVLVCDPAEQCEAPRFTVEAEASNVIIVLDRSCSMNSVVDGQTKWDRAVEAIASTVENRADDLRWGLMVFPDTSGHICDQTDPAVPVDEDGGGVIPSLLRRALEPSHRFFPGDEPCATNIDAAVTAVSRDASFTGLDGRSHVMLISDGQQAVCSSQGGEQGAVKAITDLWDRGIPTFVVGFGSGVDPDQLTRFANAGGAPAPGSTAYYQAGIDELGATLSTIIGGLGCRYDLEIGEDLARVRVTLDGRDRIEPSPTDGWSYDPLGQALLLHGDACARLQRGDVESIEVELSC